MILPLLAGLLLTKFPGGSANDLIANVAEATKHNVIVVQASPNDLPEVEYEPADLNLMVRSFRTKLGLEFVAGTSQIYSDGLIPESRFAGHRDPTKEIEWLIPMPVDGKVTFFTAKTERLDPLRLEKAKFSKPVSVHWFYDQVAVSIFANEMSEKEFFTFVAKGIGAIFSETASEYQIDFDPAAIRNRAINTTKILQKKFKDELGEDGKVPFSTPQHDAVIAILGDMPIGLIKEAFANRQSSVEFPIKKNGNAFKVAANFIDMAVTKMAVDGVLKTPAGEFTLPLRLDPNSPVTASLSAKFATSLRFGALDANNKKIPNLGFEFDRLEY